MYLDVGNGHTIWYELYGDKNGVPVVFFHGGPGACTEERHKRRFDPKKYCVLFFDQRGAGKSKPHGSIEHNTTQDLIEDTKKLMEHVGFKKAIMMGRSWGSCMSLLFSIAHPEMVSGILIGGVFLSTDRQISDIYTDWIRIFYPEVWERFIALVPEDKRSNPGKYYYEKILENGPDARKYLEELGRYEPSFIALRNNPKTLEAELNIDPTRSGDIIMTHYLSQRCFLPDNYILDNAHQIAHIPLTIVQGRYDMVCPPESAWALHKKLPKSRLIFTIEGHLSSPAGDRKLAKELARLALVF